MSSESVSEWKIRQRETKRIYHSNHMHLSPDKEIFVNGYLYW